MSDLRKLAQDIGAAPLGDLIASVGRGVAEAQAALDAESLEKSLALYADGDDLTRIMRETGYRPTFYAIPETEGELTLSMTVTGKKAPRPAPRTPTFTPVGTTALARRIAAAPRIYAAPVDGGYRNSYGFTGMTSAEAATRAEDFDLSLAGADEANADAKVTAQNPAADTVTREGNAITLTFA